MTNKDCSTWIEIDSGAVAHNIRLIQLKTKNMVMAVVKANAYGHGIIPVAESALRGGADYLGVARIEEALVLRNAGINHPILVMGNTPEGMVTEGIDNNISITVWNLEQIIFASSSTKNRGSKARLHLKVDTGMSRLGAQPEEISELAREINNLPGVTFEGLFTHLARADEKDQETTSMQLQTFSWVVEGLSSAGLRPPLIHAANSAAIMVRPDSYFDLVRPGIAIYGLHPSQECRLPRDFRPALTWKTILSQVRNLPVGRGVSYGHEYITQSPEWIGTVPVGYADGFRRVSGNQVLIGGQFVPVIGRVCMDQISVQLDGVPDAQEGDEVVLIGRQGNEEISAESVADLWFDRINYEVVCGLSARVQGFINNWTLAKNE